MEKKVFRSRVSVLMLTFVLAVFIPGFMSMFNHRAYQGLILVGGILLLVLLLFFGMRYIISDGKLYGKIFWVIPSGSVDVKNIISVERSYNPVSSAAASLKRLELKCKKGAKWPFLLISPVREQEFFDTLKQLNPDIYIRVTNKNAAYRIWDWDI
jgi:hypothetical protein